MIILEELGLDYEPIYIDTSSGDQKKESHTKYNPNGRIPTLIDHKNNDFVVWYVHVRFAECPHTDSHYRESCAIIEYLVEKYDSERKISFDKFEERIQLLQWLFFQSSGQGCVISSPQSTLFLSSFDY